MNHIYYIIRSFDDRIEISNLGGLPKGLFPEDFDRRAVRRNPIIASLLQRSKFVENMGTGINRIKQLLEENGNPAAKFYFGDFYSITFF